MGTSEPDNLDDAGLIGNEVTDRRQPQRSLRRAAQLTAALGIAHAVLYFRNTAKVAMKSP